MSIEDNIKPINSPNRDRFWEWLLDAQYHNDKLGPVFRKLDLTDKYLFIKYDVLGYRWLPWNYVNEVISYYKQGRRGYSNWFLDETDATFNDFAVDVLKFHLGINEDKKFKCVAPEHDPEYREKMFDLIERFEEPYELFTDEEMKALRSHRVDNVIEDVNREKTQEERDIYEAHRKREKEYLERIRQARHDFVDLLPRMWS